MEAVTITGSVLGSLLGALSGNLGAAILGACVGAGVTSYLVRVHETSRERKNRSLDLIQEYTSPDYIQIRNDAGRALRKAFGEINIPSWDKLHSKLPQSEWQKISKIEHFYKKLDFLLSIGELDEKYIDAYFSTEYWHWQRKYFTKINDSSDIEEAIAKAIIGEEISELQKEEGGSDNIHFKCIHLKVKKP